LLFWRTDFGLPLFIGDGSGFLQPNRIGCPFFYWKDEYVAYLEQLRREGKLVDDSVNVKDTGADSNINKAAMLDTGGDSNIKDSIAGALTEIKKLVGLCKVLVGLCKVACLLLLCILFVLLLLLCAILLTPISAYPKMCENIYTILNKMV